jgi:hypothetical protein
MPTTESEILYTRSFKGRALRIAVLTIVPGVIVGVVAVAAVPLLLGVALLLIVVGVIASLTTTTRLEIHPGRVTRRTRLGERNYEASAVVAWTDNDQRDVFVLAQQAKVRKVVCVFSDSDVDRVRAALAAAGIELTAKAPSA